MGKDVDQRENHGVVRVDVGVAFQELSELLQLFEKVVQTSRKVWGNCHISLERSVLRRPVCAIKIVKAIVAWIMLKTVVILVGGTIDEDLTPVKHKEPRQHYEEHLRVPVMTDEQIQSCHERLTIDSEAKRPVEERYDPQRQIDRAVEKHIH